MRAMAVPCAALLALLVSFSLLVSAEKLQFDIIVPDFEVKGKDAYMCTTVPLPEKPYKLVGVEPLAEKSVVHHILLFGGCR